MILVEPQNLSDAWREAQSWIDAAVRVNQGDEDTTDVLIALARGQYSLWLEPGVFAAVTKVEKWPRQTVGTILYLGGRDLKAIERCFEEGKDFARKNGINVLRVYGRSGWEKLLGLERKGVILQAAL